MYDAQDRVRITSCGEQLKSLYLGMDVLHKWQSGRHINWQTGEPDDPGAVSGRKTHCSAFVAAAYERRGIYILRPPEHKQELLANAQLKWLTSDQAKDFGWHPITKIFYLKHRKWQMKAIWSLHVPKTRTGTYRIGDAGASFFKTDSADWPATHSVFHAKQCGCLVS
ncbi:hypothetical protein FY557_13355 [Chryseobacterium sp. SN22]|uniref:hypothetical protein n=1 Tax=Chryseobacterium sp. SN22 TaxID=2606431 RepID=UPI0011F06DE0|nr:hypothetical protein [Chryseobacterium sp. SN22]KAA0127356.1 hypothetical protein FY557_13355 [Chryseobacterium sp. SN22]